jgi:hypothetical protein
MIRAFCVQNNQTDQGDANPANNNPKHAGRIANPSEDQSKEHKSQGICYHYQWVETDEFSG